MTDLRDAVADALTPDFAERVIRVEQNGDVWVSGMNAYYGAVARDIQTHLKELGFDVDEPKDDGAFRFGGSVVPVRATPEVTDA